MTVVRTELTLPEGWVSRSDLVKNFSLVASTLGLGDPERYALQSSVPKVEKFLDGLPGERDAWILPNLAGRVDAVLTVRGYLGAPGDRELLLEALSAPAAPGSGVDVINRSVWETVLDAGPAVETHDFSVAHGFESGTRPASERATATIFPTDHDWVIEFLLVTQDLLLFQDARAYLHLIAERALAFEDVSR